MRVVSALGLGLLVSISACSKAQLQPTDDERDRGLTTQERISYPADRYPILHLPDGRRAVVRSVLNLRHRMRFGDYVWNDAGVPAGPTWIRIDLARQTMSIFRADHEIGSAVILFGTDGKPTPSGIFHVLAKAELHRSTLYDAEMPYMLRLTHDGVAIHASTVQAGWATHGCIGVPYAFARHLYQQMRLGGPVAILPLQGAGRNDRS